MNVAVGLSRLGLTSSLLTAFGDDEYGRMLADHLISEGVTVATDSCRAGEPTSRAIAVIGADGAAVYDFDIEWSLSESAAITAAADAEIVHVGSIGAALEPGATAVRAMLAAVSDRTLRTYDPNIRPALLGPRDVVVACVEAIMAASHVVKLSDEDADWLYPGLPVEQVLARVLDRGARVAVITRGGDGCVMAIAGAGEPVARPARSVSVADTIGAGDAFMSGFLFGIVASGLVATLTAEVFLPDADDLRGLERVADTALASAAVAVSRTGAAPPYPHELERVSSA